MDSIGHILQNIQKQQQPTIEIEFENVSVEEFLDQWIDIQHVVID